MLYNQQQKKLRNKKETENEQVQTFQFYCSHLLQQVI